MKRLAVCTLICFTVLVSIGQAMDYGHFEGTVKAEWLPHDGGHGRMTLLEDFTYVDPSGKKWTAKRGYKTDGASIPRAFWSIVGGPYEGPYRDAAVIHDWYCDAKTEPWKDVHRIFYYACRAAGLSESKSKLLYAAVRIGGPKWGDSSSRCYSCHGIETKTYSRDSRGRLTNHPSLTDRDAKDIADWVKTNNPSLEQIDKFSREKYPNSEFGHER